MADSDCQDANSVSGNPQYVSNADLHVSLATNSVLNNNGGTGTGITTDFDGQSRSVTVPDIGADEFQGTYVVNLTIALEACPSNNITVALYTSWMRSYCLTDNCLHRSGSIYCCNTLYNNFKCNNLLDKSNK
ncbi:MAG: hypothetical protein IPL16_11955 [Ignavibacteria bacterium]|nr:hypothetical protein [Ignavibacteria bacterium]